MKQAFTIENSLELLKKLGAVALAGGLLAGCASTPDKNSNAIASSSTQAGMSKEQILQHGDVKGKPPTVFDQPLEQVRQAGLRSLTFVGCEIKKQEPYYLSGRRPNKFGLFVGSGGETVELFLYPQSEKETQVWVDTDLSFVGMAGQQSWNDQVIGEIKNILNKPAQPQ